MKIHLIFVICLGCLGCSSAPEDSGNTNQTSDTSETGCFVNNTLCNDVCDPTCGNFTTSTDIVLHVDNAMVNCYTSCTVRCEGSCEVIANNLTIKDCQSAAKLIRCLPGKLRFLGIGNPQPEVQCSVGNSIVCADARVLCGMKC